jgi:hypothetical protein
MIVVHHLNNPRSQPILWLLEDLARTSARWNAAASTT